MKYLTSINYLFLLIIILFFAACSDCEFKGIKPDSLPEGNVNKPYTAQIEHESDCQYSSKSCTKISGELPSGIKLEGTGLISGLPQSAGVYNFTIKYELCFGSGGWSASDCHEKTKSYTITVKQ